MASATCFNYPCNVLSLAISLLLLLLLLSLFLGLSAAKRAFLQLITGALKQQQQQQQRLQMPDIFCWFLSCPLYNFQSV
jgi:hypothetical protein